MYTVWHVGRVDNKKAWHLCHGTKSLEGAMKVYTEQVIKHGAENIRLFEEIAVQLSLTAHVKGHEQSVDLVAGEGEEEDGS